MAFYDTPGLYYQGQFKLHAGWMQGGGRIHPRTVLMNDTNDLNLNWGMIFRKDTYVNARSRWRLFQALGLTHTIMSVPAPTPQEMAAQAAAAAAARQFNIEAFTLLGVGLTVTALRTYVRISSVGVKRLQVDDYLVWFAAVRKSKDKPSESFKLIDALQICYSVETALAYSVGNAAHGLANNGMTPEQRASLSPDSPEWALR